MRIERKHAIVVFATYAVLQIAFIVHDTDEPLQAVFYGVIGFSVMALAVGFMRYKWQGLLRALACTLLAGLYVWISMAILFMGRPWLSIPLAVILITVYNATTRIFVGHGSIRRTEALFGLGLSVIGLLVLFVSTLTRHTLNIAVVPALLSLIHGLALITVFPASQQPTP